LGDSKLIAKLRSLDDAAEMMRNLYQSLSNSLTAAERRIKALEDAPAKSSTLHLRKGQRDGIKDETKEA